MNERARMEAIQMKEEDRINDNQSHQFTIPVSLLEGLPDDDSLRSVLLWLPASDHEYLWKSCRRIREVFSSRIFAQERCVQGFAEVSVSIVDQAQAQAYGDYGVGNYDIKIGPKNRYGVIFCEAVIIVDGRNAGAIEAQLLPMNTTSFHKDSARVSSELQRTSCLFFTNQGEPTRVRSIKKAYQDFIALEPFAVDCTLLYISEFKLKQPYRTTSLVGSQVLRLFFAKIEWNDLTKHRWTIAMYIPVCTTRTKTTEEDIRYPENHTISEIRMFQRAGFLQVKETVMDTDFYHVFCTPTFLENDMLTDEQTLAIPIETKPKPFLEPANEAKELLQYISKKLHNRKFCRRQYLATVISFQVAALDHPMMQKLKDPIHEAEATIGQKEKEYQKLKDEISEAEALSEKSGSSMPSEKLEMWKKAVDGLNNNTRAMRETVQLARSNANNMYKKISQQVIVKATQKLKILDEEFRLKVAEAVLKFGYNIISESHAIHACARSLDNTFIKILMEFLPLDKRAQIINELNTNRVTPLMIAASTWQSEIDDEEELHIHTCQLLSSLGADSDICDFSERTALGRMRLAFRNFRDYSSIFDPKINWKRDIDHSRQLESLLMPSNGPTEADDECLDDLALTSNVEDNMDIDDNIIAAI